MNGLLLLLIGCVTLDFCVGSALSWLNERWRQHALPAQVADVYDADTYSRQQSYQKAKSPISWVSRCIEFLLTILLLSTGAIGWYYGLCAKWFTNPYWATSCFFATYVLLSQLIDAPLAYYSVFVIEERFGFNKSTKARFVADLLKTAAISVAITVGLCDLVLYIYELVGDALWLWGSLACTVIMVLFTAAYSVVIVPMFNKQTPLADGDLRNAIATAAAAAGFRIKNIYVIDGSKRSTKANAYFTGFGPQKRIVLYDTLIDQLTTREIVAVLMHEIGHYRHHDIIRSIGNSVIQTAAYFYIFALLLSSPECSVAMGYGEWSFALSMVAFTLLTSPLELVLSPMLNALSRRAERRADNFATDAGYGTDLISALKKLSSQSLSNLTPHPAYVWFHYSHPTLAHRISNINEKISK